MGRIFIAAAEDIDRHFSDRRPSAAANRLDDSPYDSEPTITQDPIWLRDWVVTELRSRGLEVFLVPEHLGAWQALAWVNTRAHWGDVALEIRSGDLDPSQAPSAQVFHIAYNQERRQDAELILRSLVRRVPDLSSQGTCSDTQVGLGFLPFCRRLQCPSLVMRVQGVTADPDRSEQPSQPQDVVLGIADGLSAWSRTTPKPPPPPKPLEFSPIRLTLNGQACEDRGILVQGNPYLPIDIVDQLGIDATTAPQIRRLNHGQVVFVRAIELRDFNLSVHWQDQTQTLILRSTLRTGSAMFDRIMSNGSTTEVQLVLFLKNVFENALEQFPEIAQLYREEGSIEGVNYDIAFSQMCLETNFLQFGDRIQASQNNFAGLGDGKGSSQGATFPSARIGVRAHIQLLKAYASQEPLAQEVVTPRFRSISRGVAPSIEQLSGRWSADVDYGDRLQVMLRRLYEFSQLL